MAIEKLTERSQQMSEKFVVCPYCAEMIYGINAGDIVNNLRIHFSEECENVGDNAR
jgi:hypothetical protein